MKMVSIDVTVLVDDDVSAENVRKAVSDGLELLDDAPGGLEGYEWYEVATTSERPYAVEK